MTGRRTPARGHRILPAAGPATGLTAKAEPWTRRVNGLLVALPLMTSASGIYAGMAVYAVGLVISWICGFIFTWLFASKNVDLS